MRFKEKKKYWDKIQEGEEEKTEGGEEESGGGGVVLFDKSVKSQALL